MAALAGTYVRLSGTVMVCPNPCSLIGIFIQTATGAAVSIMDGSNTVAVFAAAAVSYYPLPFNCLTNCSVTASGTITATLGFC